MIKVCGMREPENIRSVAQLGVDLIGLIFWPKSKRYVRNIPVRAGIVPDQPSISMSSACEVKSVTSVAEAKSSDIPSAGEAKRQNNRKPAIVGVFVNEMPQTVITHAYNYCLDYLQLHGSESATYIDNLRRTLVPDILPNVKFIKAISVREASDIAQWRQYQGHADMLLFDTKCKSVGGSGEHFDWSVLESYDGDIPFLLSGGIGPDDAEALLRFRHPQCVGYDLNSRFEEAPGVKDIEKLRQFLSAIRQR